MVVSANKHIMQSKSSLYLIMILALSLGGVISITLISLADLDRDNTGIIAAIVGFLTPTILSLMALMVKDTHDLTNSRMTELLEVNKKASRAEGKLEGSSSEKI